ncbi:MAG: T9SS type A sorting domain-containing protein [Sphingobacteriales bacterium]|nr:MAG: T9SS type A sorting domain-containing protein [Sphingobacteriales bacterium]
MNSKYYALALAAMSLSVSVQAQQATFSKDLKQMAQRIVATNNHRPQQLTNAVNSRLIASSFYQYSTTTAAFSQADTMMYRYSNGRGGDLVQPIKADTVARVGFPQSTPISVFFDANTYDANDNMLTHLELVNNSGIFTVKHLKHFVYDAANRIINDTSFEPSIAGTWEPSIAVTYTYDASGNLKEQQYFGYAGGNWQPYPWQIIDHTYTAGNQLLNQVILAGSGGTTTTPQYRNLFTYSGGNRTSWTYQSWDFTNNLWKDEQKEDYWYNTAGDLEELVSYIDLPIIGLDTQGKNVYTYDANHNLTQTLGIWFNSNTRTFYEANRLTFTSNSYGQTTRVISETAGGTSGWTYESGDFDYHYYYEDYYPTTVAKLQQQGGALKVYPVPANNSLNVDIKWDVEQAYTLTIADMMGRVVHSEQRTENSEQSAIDISMLPAGAYNIILKGDKGGLQHSKFTIAR